MKRLFGMVALVTGGAQGIGRAICEAYAREGARVAVADVLLENATRVATDIDGLALRLDVTDLASIFDGVRAVEEKWGGIDILVNNAGIFNMSPVEDIAFEDYRRQYDVNVGGTIFVTQAVVPGMKRRA
ncbi:MAG: SDR family NAD(P)-dependent oxidoreductase, partial [Boseongicola sp.]|nr:SDR family NAD(P)-dependent oxidoreductase [Boseongicola sp.]